MYRAMAVVRGCGTRKKGGTYMECGVGPDGTPLEEFLVDPPVPILPEEIGLSPIGVRVMKKEGRVCVFDWVGSQYYPNVADFLEEARRFGISRRLPKGLAYSELKLGSVMILVHAAAVIEDVSPYVARDVGNQTPWRGTQCPKGLPGHPRDYDGMCARHWWNDLSKTEGPLVPMPSTMSDLVGRKMPSFEYVGRLSPEGAYLTIHPRKRTVGIFAVFPISRMVVINDPEGGAHEDALERARKSGLPVDLEEA